MKNLTYTMFALAVVASMTAGSAIAAAGGNGNGNAGGNGNGKGAGGQQATVTQASAGGQQATVTQASAGNTALNKCYDVINGVNGSGGTNVDGTANSDTNSNDPKDAGGHVTNCDKYWQSTGEIGNGLPAAGMQDNF